MAAINKEWLMKNRKWLWLETYRVSSMRKKYGENTVAIQWDGIKRMALKNVG